MEADSALNITRDSFNSAVSEILKRPEYSHLKNQGLDIIDKFKDLIKELIRRLLKMLAGNVDAIHVSDRTAYIVLAICLALIAVVFIIIVFKIIKMIDKNKKVRELFGTVINATSTPVDFMEKSREYKENKDYRNAVKFSFIAILLMMHKNNIIYLDEAKTNGEILSLLKNKGFNMMNIFQAMVHQFDTMWYGHRIMTEEGFNSWEQNAAILWEGVQHGAEKK